MTQRAGGPAAYFPSIEKKYGQPISYWLELISTCELTKHKAVVDWLKAEHGLGHGHATALAVHARAQPATTDSEPGPSKAPRPARRHPG